MRTENQEQVLRGVVERDPARNGQSERNGHFPTHYEVLGVDTSADADTLAEAYGALRSRYHPDQNARDPLAAHIVRYLDSA
jgi:DnaJ-class molecular chaperone